MLLTHDLVQRSWAEPNGQRRLRVRGVGQRPTAAGRGGIWVAEQVEAHVLDSIRPISWSFGRLLGERAHLAIPGRVDLPQEEVQALRVNGVALVQERVELVG